MSLPYRCSAGVQPPLFHVAALVTFPSAGVTTIDTVFVAAAPLSGAVAFALLRLTGVNGTPMILLNGGQRVRDAQMGPEKLRGRGYVCTGADGPREDEAKEPVCELA